MAGRQLGLMAGVAVCLGALQGIAAVQFPTSDLVTARGYSGQFVAYAARSATLSPALSSLATNQAFVQLEPILATVSCERIKQILLRELGVKTPWRGMIYLVLYPATGNLDTITIVSERSRNGWQYQVALPNVVERPRYVSAIVQVLLLELANRTAQERSAEIPLWLTEGFSQLLLASNEAEIILLPPRAVANGLSYSATRLDMHKRTPLQQAEKKLSGHPPLTFEALSWPTDQELANDASGQVFRGSAQLFLSELLRLRDARACLRTMLAQLPQRYNWQFAFLDAFRSYFERPLDVEKWWALSLAQATGRYVTQVWPLTESWQKLDQTVHAAVQVRTGANELPLRAEVSLQTMIREWDPLRQTLGLNNMLRELGLLRLRIAPEYVGLLEDYSQAIGTYLQQRDRSAAGFLFTKRAAHRRAVEEAVQRLDALDARRLALLPGPTPTAAGLSPALPSPAP